MDRSLSSPRIASSSTRCASGGSFGRPFPKGDPLRAIAIGDISDLYIAPIYLLAPSGGRQVPWATAGLATASGGKEFHRETLAHRADGLDAVRRARRRDRVGGLSA